MSGIYLRISIETLNAQTVDILGVAFVWKGLFMKANEHQPGGDHYKRFGSLQPWDVILYFQLPYLVGSAVKYLLRYQYKQQDQAGQILDLEKAKHYIEKQLEELRKETAPNSGVDTQ